MDKSDRDRRLAEALRANLKRRKQQERARARGAGDVAGEGEATPGEATRPEAAQPEPPPAEDDTTREQKS